MTSGFPQSRLDLFFEDRNEIFRSTPVPIGSYNGTEVSTFDLQETSDILGPNNTFFSILALLSLLTWLFNHVAPNWLTTERYRYLKNVDYLEHFKKYPEEVVLSLLEEKSQSRLIPLSKERGAPMYDIPAVDLQPDENPPKKKYRPSYHRFDGPVYVKKSPLEQFQSGLTLSFWSRAYDVGKYIIQKILILLNSFLPLMFSQISADILE